LVATFPIVRHYLAFTGIAAIGRIPPSLEPFVDLPSDQVGAARAAGEAAVVKDDRLQQQGVLNVTKSHLVAVLALCAAGLAWMSVAGSPALAQDRPAPPIPIVLVDIQLIFKEHAVFKAEMSQLHDDLNRADAEAKKESQAIQNIAEGVKELTLGSPDYKRAQEEVIQRSTALKMRMQTQQQEIMLRNAQICNRVYQEIYQEVDYYCRANNIALALNYDSQKVELNKPDQVLHMVMRPVVYRDGRLDITQQIIANLARRRGPAPAANNGTAEHPNYGQGVGAYH
jgi:Skp family chaperone for outer membrane proteins